MDGKQFTLSEAQASKLTTWKNEPTLQVLKGDLEAARSSQQAMVAKIQLWQDLMSAEGQAAPPKVKGRSAVQPKLVRRQAEWRYSALTEPFLSSKKVFKCEPVTFEDGPAARQNELLLNYQFRNKIGRVNFIDNFVRATVDEGTSITKVGWIRITIPVKEEVPVYSFYPIEDPKQAELFSQALDLRTADPRSYHEKIDPLVQQAVTYYDEAGIPTYAVQTGTQTVTTDKVIENRPTLEILNPRNVYIDPACNGDLDKALFSIISFETNQATLKKEPKRYKNLDKVNWSSNTPLSTPNHETMIPSDYHMNDPLRKKVVAFEYWGYYDIRGDGVLRPFVATWIGDVIIRMEENPFPDEKIPLVLAPYLPVKRDLYGEPDAVLLEDNQKVLGAVTRGMIDLLGKSANGQQGFAKGMLDALNRRRFENGQDYEFNPGYHPSQSWVEHKYPELPQSALTIYQMFNQDSEALTGVKAFSGGLSGEAYGQVATAIRGLLDAASKREMAILRRLAEAMSKIANKMIAMNAVFLSEEEVVRVTNEEYVTIRREDLKGNFDVETDISTIEVDNMKAQDLGFILQTLGPNADPQVYMRILAEICDLKRMPVLAHELKNWKPQPNPIQEQLQQLEVALKTKQVEELDSQIQLNQAKAKQAMAQTDLTNLDYVEQEKGVKHARDMQKQGAQAEGNENLEMMKGLLKPTKEGEKKPDFAAALGFKALSQQLKVASEQGAGLPN